MSMFITKMAMASIIEKKIFKYSQQRSI